MASGPGRKQSGSGSNTVFMMIQLYMADSLLTGRLPVQSRGCYFKNMIL